MSNPKVVLYGDRRTAGKYLSFAMGKLAALEKLRAHTELPIMSQTLRIPEKATVVLHANRDPEKHSIKIKGLGGGLSLFGPITEGITTTGIVDILKTQNGGVEHVANYPIGTSPNVVSNFDEEPIYHTINKSTFMKSLRKLYDTGQSELVSEYVRGMVFSQLPEEDAPLLRAISYTTMTREEFVAAEEPAEAVVTFGVITQGNNLVVQRLNDDSFLVIFNLSIELDGAIMFKIDDISTSYPELIFGATDLGDLSDEFKIPPSLSVINDISWDSEIGPQLRGQGVTVIGTDQPVTRDTTTIPVTRFFEPSFEDFPPVVMEELPDVVLHSDYYSNTTTPSYEPFGVREIYNLQGVDQDTFEPVSHIQGSVIESITGYTQEKRVTVDGDVTDIGSVSYADNIQHEYVPGSGGATVECGQVPVLKTTLMAEGGIPPEFIAITADVDYADPISSVNQTVAGGTVLYSADALPNTTDISYSKYDIRFKYGKEVDGTIKSEFYNNFFDEDVPVYSQEVAGVPIQSENFQVPTLDLPGETFTLTETFRENTLFSHFEPENVSEGWPGGTCWYNVLHVIWEFPPGDNFSGELAGLFNISTAAPLEVESDKFIFKEVLTTDEGSNIDNRIGQREAKTEGDLSAPPDQILCNFYMVPEDTDDFGLCTILIREENIGQFETLQLQLREEIILSDALKASFEGVSDILINNCFIDLTAVYLHAIPGTTYMVL